MKLTRLFTLSMLMTCFFLNLHAQDTLSSAQLENTAKVSIETSMGKIVVALYNETPLHRDNFIKLVKDGYYDGLLFHRVIKDFMVQAGDPDSKNAAPGARLGNGDPGYTIPAEIVFPKYYHKRGALAAARTSDQVNPFRRSSGSQFYIVTGKVVTSQSLGMTEMGLANQMKENIYASLLQEKMDSVKQLQAAGNATALQELQQELVPMAETEFAAGPKARYTPEAKKLYTTIGGTPHLDAQYTVFGEVLQGMDVVDKIQQVAVDGNDRPAQDVRIIKATVVE